MEIKDGNRSRSDEEIRLESLEETELSIKDCEYFLKARIDAIASGTYSGKPAIFIIDWKTGHGELEKYADQVDLLTN